MAERTLKIEFYKDKNIDALSKAIADPEEKAEAGSAAAAAAALAAGLISRAARMIARDAEAPSEEIDWLVRNTEILRTYFVKLVDEDVRCRGPLRKAEQEGDPHKIEAARQTAVAICAEIIHMVTSCLEVAEKMLPYRTQDAAPYLEEAVELSVGAAKMCVPFILRMGSFSPDETYRYVLKRENELNIQEVENIAGRIRAALREA